MGLVISRVIDLVVILFVARALLSWFRPQPGSPIWPIADGIYRATEPILAPIRRALPPMGGLDLSVLIVIIVLRAVVRPLLL